MTTPPVSPEVPTANTDGEVVSGSAPKQGTPPPVWKDCDQFFDLMTSRGWTWPMVLSWLKAAPSAGFFDLTSDQRRRAAEHLQHHTPPTVKTGKK